MGEPWTILAVRNCLSLSRFILTFSSPIYPFYICSTTLNSFICVPFHSKSLDMQFRKPRFLSIYPEVLTNPQRLFKILRPAQTLVIDTFIELFSFFFSLTFCFYTTMSITSTCIRHTFWNSIYKNMFLSCSLSHCI